MPLRIVLVQRTRENSRLLVSFFDVAPAERAKRVAWPEQVSTAKDLIIHFFIRLLKKNVLYKKGEQFVLLLSA